MRKSLGNDPQPSHRNQAMSITIIKRQCQTLENNRETNRYCKQLNIIVDVKGWEMMEAMMPHISNTVKINVILDKMFDDKFDMAANVPEFFQKIMERNVRGTKCKNTTIQLNVDGDNFKRFDNFMCRDGKVATLDIVKLFIVNITNCFADPIRCGFLLDELQRVICK